MKVLIACEFSGIVREAFKEKGHDAWSCDLLPTEIGGNHIQRDVLSILNDGWDLMIAHPPCSHIAVSGAAWFKQKIADGRQQQGIDFFMKMVNAPIPKICVENPVSIMSTIYRKPDQIIQPWQFGDEYQKTTCLWLKNLPILLPTKIVGKGPFYIDSKGKRRWYGIHNLGPSPQRPYLRSKTFVGIAKAMADQWG